MKFLFNTIHYKGKPVLSVAVLIWFAFALIAVLAELLHHSINNYLLFKGVFWHVIEQKNLYLQYPAEYFDSNHYGPLFSFIIVPFAVLPNWAGVILWVLANAYVLYYAIRKLPIAPQAILTIYLITAIEFMTSSHNVQFNPMLTGWILLSYILVSREKDIWATLFIVAGFYVKLYGIVGILFFIFSKHKAKFIGSFLFWMVILFCLPMLISSPEFIIQTYKDWANALAEKNISNVIVTPDNMQDISVMGMIRRTFNYPQLPNLSVIVPAAILLALPLLRFRLHKNKVFQLYYLCLVLISVVIYSSSAESATYVLAVTGVALWYVLNMHRKNILNTLALIMTFLLTSLSATDLCPYYLKHYIILAYALKALPCFIVWLILIWNVAFAKEDSFNSPVLNEA